MSAYTIDFHPSVESDYDEAFQWYELQKEGLGEQFLLHVRQKLIQIITAPQTYGAKGNIRYREALVDGFPYLIIYKIYPKSKHFFVSSIHHARKNPKKKYRK
jgi:hypothetical protein